MPAAATLSFSHGSWGSTRGRRVHSREFGLEQNGERKATSYKPACRRAHVHTPQLLSLIHISEPTRR
eukprot:3450822-Lingulodinium_polyedra.AAC.1